MPNRIVLKKGTTAGTAPSASDLVAGELAINTADGGLFTKLDDGSVYTVAYRNTEGLPVARGGTGATSASSARTNLGLAIGTNVQAWDADLDAIAALSGTSGLLRKTAANTWSLDTASYLTGNQSVTLSGDASGTGSTAITVTLANSGVSAGTYNNSATAVRPFTVDAKGRITSIGTAVTITPAWASITSTPTTLSGYNVAATDVTGQVLTNYTVGSNTAIAATDTILQAFQKVQGQINAAVGGSGGSSSKYSVLVGNGTNTTFTVTHNLGSTELFVQVVRESSGAFVYPDVTVVNANSISVAFTTAPSTNEYRVNVLEVSSVASGSAGTKTLAVFTPLDNNPPATNFATLDTRNSIAVLDFDAATDESAVFVGVIPEGAALSSGIQVRLSWSATTATSGVCVWEVAIEKTTGHDIDSDSFDTAVTGSTTTDAASGFINTTSITITTIDSIVAGDTFRLRVTRDADAGADTMTGDAELIAVELRAV
jgi:hypothetical protein